MNRLTEIPDIEEYKLAAYEHAEAHSDAGSDFELCDHDECPYWPDWWSVPDANEVQW